MTIPMMESFWGTLQLELLDIKEWQTRDELANAIFEDRVLV
jgi:putative transposase